MIRVALNKKEPLIKRPITADGRTGFDQFNQLVALTKPDELGWQSGHFIRDVRGCSCYICGRTWGNTTEELMDQTSTDNGERIMHETCLYGVRKMNAHSDIQNALIDAKYLFYLEEVPPRYPESTPWQRVTVLCNDKNRTDSGYRVVLGRRKRVWEVRLHNCGDLSAKFEEVPHTKGYSEAPSEEEPEFGPYYYVHAWEKKELVDFLTRLREAIPVSTSREFI